MHTLFYFIVAIGILVSFHEFGHFWVARKSGVKVLRFSIGFGKVIWSYQKNKQATEYVISAIPLGGYVKMVDEREGEVKPEDLPYAFNRQSLKARAAIVAAGPIFNLMLAVLLFWMVLVIGETGVRPIIGPVESGTIAAEAGLQEKGEIVSVNGETTATWSEVIESVFTSVMDNNKNVEITVKNGGVQQQYVLNIPTAVDEDPKVLYEKLGLVPWFPEVAPVVGNVIEGKAASKAGLKTGDVIISADGESIKNWMQWVKIVQSHANSQISIEIERGGSLMSLNITPEPVTENGETIGKIGAAVKIPQDLIDSMRVTHSLPVLSALSGAFSRTVFYSAATFKMIGRMLIGEASLKNLSGPISIAQYAGLSAERGMVEFFSFLAKISISLGVLNLLPIPVLDGGHLVFFAFEAIKGKPISERIQILFQQVGILLLLTLMLFAVIQDIERLFQ